MYNELEHSGYKPMSKMTKAEEELLEEVVSAVEKEFHIRFTAKDLSIKKMICEQCGGEAFCIHVHSMVKGSRHPELMVDVDDVIEICTDCGIKRRIYDETYETNSELRMTNCSFCGRDFDSGDLKVFNRTSY